MQAICIPEQSYTIYMTFSAGNMHTRTELYMTVSAGSTHTWTALHVSGEAGGTHTQTELNDYMDSTHAQTEQQLNGEKERMSWIAVAKFRLLLAWAKVWGGGGSAGHILEIWVLLFIHLQYTTHSKIRLPLSRKLLLLSTFYKGYRSLHCRC